MRRAGDDFVQNRLQRLVGRRKGFDEFRRAVSVALVHAVQHHAVQVDVQVGGRPKALDQREGAAVGFVGLKSS